MGVGLGSSWYKQGNPTPSNGRRVGPLNLTFRVSRPTVQVRCALTRIVSFTVEPLAAKAAGGSTVFAAKSARNVFSPPDMSGVCVLDSVVLLAGSHPASDRE